MFYVQSTFVKAKQSKAITSAVEEMESYLGGRGDTGSSAGPPPESGTLGIYPQHGRLLPMLSGPRFHVQTRPVGTQ